MEGFDAQLERLGVDERRETRGAMGVKLNRYVPGFLHDDRHQSAETVDREQAALVFQVDGVRF